VQMVIDGAEPQVQRLLMLNGTSGAWTLPLSSRQNEVILVISALAPVTTEVAAYEILLEPAP
ncbi:MAG TPA: hypothetical protein VLH56_09685, partial [Dissulfurispiraceae bacterium]|nr:hypothetical protein [Dissulfurispiraceae bacterium]